jgi:hypothetical protein
LIALRAPHPLHARPSFNRQKDLGFIEPEAILPFTLADPAYSEKRLAIW